MAMTPTQLKQEALWRTLRMMRADMTARELAAHASLPEAPVSERFAAAWLAALARAGRVQELVWKKNLPARYRLSRDTGPLPPVFRRAKVLHDPNTGEVWLAEEADHG